MPFKSEAQRKYLYKNHPDIAAKWESEGATGDLPERIHPKKTESAYANKKPMKKIRRIFRRN